MVVSAAISPLAPPEAAPPYPFRQVRARLPERGYSGMKSGFIAKDKARDELIASTIRAPRTLSRDPQITYDNMTY